MKHIAVLVFILIAVCVISCSCSKEQNTANSFTQNNQSQIEMQKAAEAKTVKSHSINRNLNKDYYDVNKKAEEIFNIINERNGDKLKALFSSNVKNAVPELDEQIRILFDYIDEPIIDYDEGLDSGESHVDKGEVLEKDLSTLIVFQTDSKSYYMWLSWYLVDENKDNIGLDYIAFADKAEEDSRINEMTDNPYYEHSEDDGYHKGVICYAADGSILRK